MAKQNFRNPAWQVSGATAVEMGGSLSAAKLSTYMKTKDALWRMLATYPPKMPFTEALLLAKRDFTGTRKGGTPC